MMRVYVMKAKNKVKNDEENCDTQKGKEDKFQERFHKLSSLVYFTLTKNIYKYK